jgi:probable addiction module antidote protein
MAAKLPPYDPAEDLDTPEAIEFFLNDAFETGDPAYISNALGVVVRVKGMTNVAGDTGLAREQLYKSLSENGNPTLKTIVRLVDSWGFGLKVKHI